VSVNVKVKVRQQSAQQDQWLAKHYPEMDRHIKWKLGKEHKLFGEEQEEVSARAMVHVVEQVRLKAFVPGAWDDDDDVAILKRMKARVNGFLIDEVAAYRRGSQGRRITDAYDRLERQKYVDDEGNDSEDLREADIRQNRADVSPATYALEADPEQMLLHEEMWSIMDAVASDPESKVLIQVLMGEMSLTSASVLLGITTSTAHDRKNALAEKLKEELVQGGYGSETLQRFSK
jgi:DNA-directed RNA polymerase specialized sigma24 family protein